MRVLWFTNIPMPAIDAREGKITKGSGTWMTILLSLMAGSPSVKIGVVTAYPNCLNADFVDDDVRYFCIGQPKNSWLNDFSTEDLNRCAAIVEDWSPDIIHIHGTERFFGLIRQIIPASIPIVISLQGILNSITPPRVYFGNLNPLDIARCHRLGRNLRIYGLLPSYRAMKKRAAQEKKIIGLNEYFMGRTPWDHACLRAINRTAKYFHTEETIRNEFWAAPNWDIKTCSKHTIIFTNAEQPLRGVETLLTAVSILKPEFPAIKLKLARLEGLNTPYGRHLKRMIDRLELTDNIQFLGYLTAEKMIKELLASHVFAITSFIENSSLSLSEAMLLGLPCIASYVGGMKDRLRDKVSGLSFPAGDPFLLADSIRTLFSDESYAISLGQEARATVSKRQDQHLILSQNLSCYREIISQHAERSRG